jgi:hypothetical protein
VKNLSLHDPYDLVLVVVGALYARGHTQIRLDEHAIARAVPAAREMLWALGITPVESRPRNHGR